MLSIILVNMSSLALYSGEGHTIVIDFHAYKDKLVKESLLLTSADKLKSLTLKLMARVLGK